MKGYIHVYTGDGKGKTTAAFGMVLRAVGADKKVFIAQFVKGRTYSEIKATERYLPGITVKQYGQDSFIVHEPGEEDISAAARGLNEIRGIIQEESFDMVILDEANIAFHYGLFSVEDLIDILTKKKPGTEIIITGRYAPPEILEIADLVTDMQETKHYYNEGVAARKGIEY